MSATTGGGGEECGNCAGVGMIARIDVTADETCPECDGRGVDPGPTFDELASSDDATSRARATEDAINYGPAVRGEEG